MSKLYFQFQMELEEAVGFSKVIRLMAKSVSTLCVREMTNPCHPNVVV